MAGKRSKWASSLQARIVMSCIAISIITVLIVSIILYNILSGVIREKVSLSTQSKLESLSLTMDQHINSVLSFMDSFVSNSAVNAAMVSDPWTYGTSEATLISTLFKTAILSNDNIIDSIIVYTDQGKIYAGGNGNYLFVDEIKRRVAAIEQDQPIGRWTLRFEDNPNRFAKPDHTLSLYYVLRNTSSLERIGIICATIDPQRLMSTLHVADSNRQVILLDESMNIIYHSSAERIGQVLEPALAGRLTGEQGSFLFDGGDAGQQFAVYTSSMMGRWRLVEMVSNDSLTAELQQYIFYIVIILAAAFAFTLLMSVSSTRHVMGPLRRLKDSMVAVQHDNYHIALPVESDDEIGQLARTYNLMLERIRQLIAEIYTTEQKKHESDLLALQSQINPHFLYNTLNSIHWMAVVHGLTNISEMVNSLVAILRYSLSKFSSYSTLKVEVDMLEPYLFIQNVRFSNGISFSCDVPPQFERCQIPRLLLQPLVENAIAHGLRPLGGRGHIHIRCAQQDERLLVDVIDNGAGLARDVEQFTSYESLKDMFPKSEDEQSVGLENTSERIRLYFGQAYGLYLQSQAGKGTTVRVVMPIVYEEKEAGEHD